MPGDRPYPAQHDPHSAAARHERHTESAGPGKCSTGVTMGSAMVVYGGAGHSLAAAQRPTGAGPPLGPPAGDPPGPPPFPAATVPVPPVRLTATHRPGHHMWHPRHDLVIATRAAVPFHRTRPRHRADDVLVPVRPRFGPSVDIAEPATGPRRLRPGARAARISSWHDPKSRRGGIRCSRSHVGRRNPASGSESRGPRPACAPGA